MACGTPLGRRAGSDHPESTPVPKNLRKWLKIGNKNERPEAGKGSTEQRVPPAGWGDSRLNGNGAVDVAFAVDPSESGPPPQLTADELALQDRLAQRWVSSAISSYG